jgi:alkylation response protein AidB-like acyl-CoA dehydrogenase
MNFDFSDDQQAIKRTARDMLAERFKLEKVRELAEAGEYHEEAWREMCELGWAGIFIDEEHGGQGLGLVELVILCEELGYALAPVPFLSNAAAGLAIRTAGSDEQKRKWLPGIASGEARGTFGWVRDGQARLVPDAAGADVIVLMGEGTATLVEGSNADIEPLDVIDATRSYAALRADGGEELGGERGDGLYRIATAAAAELTGVAQRVMEMAVEYARDRKQFGVPIAQHQAIQFKLATIATELAAARALTHAAASADHSPDAGRLAAQAKLYASEAANRACQESLQIHGGNGFHDDYEISRLYRDVRVTTIYEGTSEMQRMVIARSLLGR